MTTQTYKFACLLAVAMLFTLLASSTTLGQRNVSYQQLAMSSQQQSTYLDFFTLPGDDSSKVKFIVTYRINYNFLPFKKLDRADQSSGRAFFSPVGISMEVFKAKEKREIEDNIPIEGLQSVARTAFKDTAFAASYEQTQSNNTFISGYLQVEVEPGLYNYMLQLTPGENTRERTSRVRQVDIKPYENRNIGEILLINDVRENQNTTELELLTFGQNVYYGRDFYTLVHLPDFSEGSEYIARINRIDINRRDTTQQEQVFEQRLTEENILKQIKPAMSSANNISILHLQQSDNGDTYALLEIPNSEYPNAVYRMEVSKDGGNRPTASTMFRSLWVEMPASLLNLDVAIEMLRFIVNKEELKRLESGSRQEREQKFREFWKSKDPTPKTEFNELMAEYYRRIDYAYEHFTTQNVVGYESDQGEIYIKYGPPNNIERKFPPGDAAVEIWTYDNRTFVFEATSGFGDFKLVDR